MPSEAQQTLKENFTFEYNGKKLKFSDIPTLSINPMAGKVKFIGMVGLKYIEHAIFDFVKNDDEERNDSSFLFPKNLNHEALLLTSQLCTITLPEIESLKQ